MKAACVSAYSTKPKDVMSIKTDFLLPDSTKLKPDEVVVQVYASSINYGDNVLVSGQPWIARLMIGMWKPAYRPGCDFAGKVTAVGSDVSEFSVGDAVYGDKGDSDFGAWAEYVVCKKKFAAKKPATLTYLEAACIPSAGTTALQAVRDHGKLAEGESVMVHGAGGGVGHFAVQLSKALGAGSVTAYTSASKMKQATNIGADTAFDYKTADFVKEKTRYDLVVDSGAYRSLGDVKTAMKEEQGKYVFCGGSVWRLLDVACRGPWVRNKNQTMGNFLVKPNTADLDFLAQLADKGNLKPVIEKQTTLDQLPDALADYVEKGVSGKIAIAVHKDADKLA